MLPVARVGDPTAASPRDHKRKTDGSHVPRYLAFTIMRRTDDPALEYSLQISSDLQTWESGSAVFEEAAVNPAGDGFEQVVYRHHLSEAGPAGRFVRLQVTHVVD